MKIAILLIFLFTFWVSELISQPNDNQKLSDTSFIEVQELVKYNFDGHKSLIFDKSKFLNDNQKYYIYNENKMDAKLPFLLNMLCGFGIGSIYQGDEYGGFIGSLFQFGGLLLFVSTNIQSLENKLGVVFFVSSYIYCLVRPWLYALSFNSDMKTVLRANHLQNLSFQPGIKVLGNGMICPELTIALNF